ncbi:MAG TPA: (2Fe-2S) ferredoxin domain-containing protein [Kofleriaceae bacterium]|nr:(2Fe-2S) ferredoxin domain-containing protein [Kofleriaceae bacterium]
MAKLPTRSPTHEEVDPTRLASIGLELEEIADGEEIPLPALVELAEDRGRPASHYLAAIPLATELRLAGKAPISVRVCAGNCQRYGALDLLDALVEKPGIQIVPVTCLDRCDQAPACEVHSASGQLVVAPASKSNLDEALAALA